CFRGRSAQGECAMSMLGMFAAIPPDTFASLREDPAALEAYLSPEDGDYPDAVHPECDHLDVSKAWHGMHFLLTGTAWEPKPLLGLAVLGGEECGEDTGYGPPRFLDVGQVREVAAALARFSIDKAVAKHSLADLDDAEIYPSNWQDDSPGRVEWLVESLG